VRERRHAVHSSRTLTGHNGGFKERLVAPAAGKQPHIVMILFDDWGWAEAGWHRNYTIGGQHVPATNEVRTPTLDSLVAEGIELDRAYVYKCCGPTRSALQSGRDPYHVNPLNSAAEIHNPADPVSGFAGVPRNMVSRHELAPCPALSRTYRPLSKDGHRHKDGSGRVPDAYGGQVGCGHGQWHSRVPPPPPARCSQFAPVLPWPCQLPGAGDSRPHPARPRLPTRAPLLPPRQRLLDLRLPV
jgi:hypothetical protein